MKRIVRTVALAAAAIFAGAANLSAQDMSGRWVLAVELDVGSGDATFELTQEENAITGTYTGALGEETVTGTVTDGTIELTFDSQAGPITYRGTVDENGVFHGTCEYGQLGGGTFRGTRAEV